MNKTSIAAALAICMAAAGNGLSYAGENRPAAAQESTTDTDSSATTHGHRYAVTCFSANYLREKADFTAELGNQLLMGTPVEIIGEDGYWRQVISPEPYKAWCLDMGLAEMDSASLSAYLYAPKYICTAMYSRILASPDKGAKTVSDLVAGDLMLAETTGTGRKCTAKKYVKVRLASGIHGYVPKKDVEAFGTWAENASATADNIICTAEKFLGIPYFWGGTSVKGVDCSGLVRMVWFLNGVLLPRNASQQAKAGKDIPVNLQPQDSTDTSGGQSLKEMMLQRISSLEKGDLIFFGTGSSISHVGIYIGNGRFIHASKTVRHNSLIPGEEDYYELSDRLVRARRVIGEEGNGNGVTRIMDSPAYFLPMDN